jgi:lon-related putative ATP-dependent protease
MGTELREILQFSLVALSSIFFIVDPLAAIPSFLVMTLLMTLISTQSRGELATPRSGILGEKNMFNQISAEKLRKVCAPQDLNCSTSDEFEPTKTIIGQERAARALRFGLGIKALGFNVYVAGVPGTGRTTMVERFLGEIAREQPVPSDWCYVNNFRDPSKPKAIKMPSGRAKQFQLDMKDLVEGARRELRKAFEGEEYIARQKETARSFEKQSEEILSQINAEAQKQDFLIQQTPMGVMTIPMRDGQPLTPEQFIALGQDEKQAISRKQQALQEQIGTALRRAKNVEKSAAEELERMDRQVALYALSHPLEELKGKYHDLSHVLAYLEEVRDDILDNLKQFTADPQAQPAVSFPMPTPRGGLRNKYAVNVLVDNSSVSGAPVVMELNPTYNNLFGRIENEAQFGTLVTDFTLIRQGSLHRSNGGYLVLPIEEVLRNPFSWDGLKRGLRNRQIVIEDVSERLGFMGTRTLQPEPIPLDVKVVLIGQRALYHLLLAYDEDFNELFKVKADFDSLMDRTEKSIRDYTLFVSAVCSDGDLKHLDSSGLAKIVEYGSRLAEDQAKLSTRFGEIADVIREANYYALQEGSPYVTGVHVNQAIEERVYRSALIQERIREMIKRGTVIIDAHGERVGQVNGLSVIDMGDIAFGQPSRITASIGVGREGLIDIEGEAKLGGPTHTKGVLILSGYLMGKYAQNKPLGLSARLVFEQSYSGVDGDSASSAELYAILSELSGLPIKQGTAVTGSVNQKGEVQAIGGVNEKIEGFFEVCKVKGLTGQQGVLIPDSNEQNLMLKEEIVAAVNDDRFHIWSVKTIDDGIEILTGVKAGARRDDGTFEEGTVNERVDKRLRELADTLVKFGKDEEEKEKKL